MPLKILNITNYKWRIRHGKIFKCYYMIKKKTQIQWIWLILKRSWIILQFIILDIPSQNGVLKQKELYINLIATIQDFPTQFGMKIWIAKQEPY
jgi:hypothetical protein